MDLNRKVLEEAERSPRCSREHTRNAKVSQLLHSHAQGRTHIIRHIANSIFAEVDFVLSIQELNRLFNALRQYDAVRTQFNKQGKDVDERVQRSKRARRLPRYVLSKNCYKC